MRFARTCWATGNIALMSATGNPAFLSSLLITAPLRLQTSAELGAHDEIRIDLKISEPAAHTFHRAALVQRRCQKRLRLIRDHPLGEPDEPDCDDMESSVHQAIPLKDSQLFV